MSGGRIMANSAIDPGARSGEAGFIKLQIATKATIIATAAMLHGIALLHSAVCVVLATPIEDAAAGSFSAFLI
jgi:hypothetical protein